MRVSEAMKYTQKLVLSLRRKEAWLEDAENKKTESVPLSVDKSRQRQTKSKGVREHRSARDIFRGYFGAMLS